MNQEEIKEYEQCYLKNYNRFVKIFICRDYDRLIIEEAIQEAFISLTKKFHIAKEECPSLEAWLFKAIIYELNHIMRREDTHKKYMDKFFGSNYCSLYTTVYDAMTEIIFSDRYIKSLFETLGVEDKKLLNFLLYSKLSDSEIVSEMGINNKLLSSRKYKLKKKIIDILEKF